MRRRIYLDTAASTPIDKRAVSLIEKTAKKLCGVLGNPSSIHQEGVMSKNTLDCCRQKVAESLVAHADEIVFTSGGTESNNLAILGVAKAYEKETGKKGHIITTTIEHSSVLLPVGELAEQGWEVTYLPVDSDGLINLGKLKDSLKESTVLISIIHASNEIGVIQPIEEIAKIIRKQKKDTNPIRDRATYPYLHLDSCQAVRFFDLNPQNNHADLITMNGSKIYGPKGVGALYVRRGVKIKPILLGGGQENGLRSGTENILGCVGFAEALAICSKERDRESLNLTEIRDYAIDKILAEIPNVTLNGHRNDRLPNNLNFTFRGVDAEWLVLQLDAKGVLCSTGSACSFNTKDQSYVIIALGKTAAEAKSSVRFTLDRKTSKKDINYLINLLKKYAHTT